MKKIALDTNVYSALMIGEEEVLKLLESADEVLISPICIGELLAGFKLGSKERFNQNILTRFLAQSTVRITPITEETSEFFATIFTTLKQNGTPIPLNDIWIAACALENGAIIATYDKHFSLIPQARLWKKMVN